MGVVHTAVVRRLTEPNQTTKPSVHCHSTLRTPSGSGTSSDASVGSASASTAYPVKSLRNLRNLRQTAASTASDPTVATAANKDAAMYNPARKIDCIGTARVRNVHKAVAN